MMRFQVWLLLLILVSSGCESRIEVPVRHVGVVVQGNNNVQKKVFGPGDYWISYGSRVVLYKIQPEKINTEFSFLSKNVLQGKLKLKLEFSPIPDSLAGFYKNYQSRYLAPVIDVESRFIIRKTLENYNPEQLPLDELESEIIQSLSNHAPISNYVKLNRVTVMDLKWETH